MSERPRPLQESPVADPQVRALVTISRQLDYQIGLLEALVSGIHEVKNGFNTLPTERVLKGRPSSPGGGRSLSREDAIAKKFRDEVKKRARKVAAERPPVGSLPIPGQLSTDDYDESGTLLSGARRDAMFAPDRDEDGERPLGPLAAGEES